MAAFRIGNEDYIQMIQQPDAEKERQAHIEMERVKADLKQEKQRTAQQNKSLHKWETMLAEKLNDSGIPFGEVVLKMPRYFTKENIHELIVKPVMTSLYPDIVSTADPRLTTKKIQEVYKHADQIISERSGVHVEWPDRHGQD